LTSKSGIFIWNRNLSIIPQYVNKIFYIYNGMRFFKLRVVPAMIGYKFGSFSFTRRILAKDYKLLNSFKNIV
jgi:ribosomal protein S19